MKNMSSFAVGSRILSDGNFATVHFIGEVPPTKGEWLGVEWDDSQRGKHDGVHEGTRYFTTKHPSSGSFLRAVKASAGITLTEAVRGRYGLVDDDNAGVDVEEMFVLGKDKRQRTTVEVVGAHSVNKQQCQFSRLREVVLRGSKVRDGGTPGAVSSLVPSVTELDLSRNLLASWATIGEIVAQLGRLRSLNVSENKLAFPEDPATLREGFSNVRTLYINRMEYTWDEVLRCSHFLTQLQEIHLCFNAVSAVPSLGDHLSNLRLLNLESNPLQGWADVLRFGQLKHLETLILTDTGIDTLTIPDVTPGQTSALFPALHTLSLSHNKISKWSEINELHKLASLTELNFKKNPLLAEYSDGTTPRTIVLAKVARLGMLNRTKVLPVERKGAQLDYLKLYGKLWRASGGHQDPALNRPSEDFIRDHPRYQQLIDLYGPVEDSELVQQTTAIKNSLITVNITCPLHPNKPPLKKKLPVTMTVQKLKMLVTRLYRPTSMDITLTYTSAKVAGLEIELETDQKDIGYYSVEEGDTIIVKWS